MKLTTAVIFKVLKGPFVALKRKFRKHSQKTQKPATVTAAVCELKRTKHVQGGKFPFQVEGRLPKQKVKASEEEPQRKGRENMPEIHHQEENVELKEELIKSSGGAQNEVQQEQLNVVSQTIKADKDARPIKRISPKIGKLIEELRRNKLKLAMVPAYREVYRPKKQLSPKIPAIIANIKKNQGNKRVCECSLEQIVTPNQVHKLQLDDFFPWAFVPMLRLVEFFAWPAVPMLHLNDFLQWAAVPMCDLHEFLTEAFVEMLHLHEFFATVEKPVMPKNEEKKIETRALDEFFSWAQVSILQLNRFFQWATVSILSLNDFFQKENCKSPKDEFGKISLIENVERSIPSNQITRIPSL